MFNYYGNFESPSPWRKISVNRERLVFWKFQNFHESSLQSEILTAIIVAQRLSRASPSPIIMINWQASVSLLFQLVIKIDSLHWYNYDLMSAKALLSCHRSFNNSSKFETNELLSKWASNSRPPTCRRHSTLAITSNHRQRLQPENVVNLN